jgi:hypothetical protein
VRIALLRLTDPGYKLRAGSEDFFRATAVDIGKQLEHNDGTYKWFTEYGLWDLYVLCCVPQLCTVSLRAAPGLLECAPFCWHECVFALLSPRGATLLSDLVSQGVIVPVACPQRNRVPGKHGHLRPRNRHRARAGAPLLDGCHACGSAYCCHLYGHPLPPPPLPCL